MFNFKKDMYLSSVFFFSNFSWGFALAYSIPKEYVHMCGGDLGWKAHPRGFLTCMEVFLVILIYGGVFLGSFQLTRKSLMMYDPLERMTHWGVCIGDSDSRGSFLGNPQLTGENYGEVHDDSDLLGKTLLFRTH